MQTNVLIKEEYILKNKNKSCPYKKLSVFYNSCLKTYGSHLKHGTHEVGLLHGCLQDKTLTFKGHSCHRERHAKHMLTIRLVCELRWQ